MNEYTVEEMRLESELKPCPFCNEPGMMTRNPSYGKLFNYIAVQCSNWSCPVKPRTNYHTDAQAACEEWNKRKSPAEWETNDAARLWALQNFLQGRHNDWRDQRKFFEDVYNSQKANLPEDKNTAYVIASFISKFEADVKAMKTLISGNDIPAPPNLEDLYGLIKKLVGAARWGLENVKHAKCLRETELARPDMADQQKALFDNLSRSFSETIEKAQSLLDKRSIKYYGGVSQCVDKALKRNDELKAAESRAKEASGIEVKPPLYTHGCEILNSDHEVIAVCRTIPEKKITGTRTAEDLAASMNRYMFLRYDTQMFDKYAHELRRCKCGKMPQFGLRWNGGAPSDIREIAVTCPTCGVTTELCTDHRAAIEEWNRLFAMDKKKAKEIYGDDDQKMGN